MVVVDAGEHGTLKYTIDSEFRMNSTSRYTLMTLGYRPDELIGKSAALFSGRDWPAMLRALHQARGQVGQRSNHFRVGSLQARDGHCVNIGATFFWNELSQIWDISAVVISSVPADEQVFNVSKLVQLVEVHPEDYGDSPSQENEAVDDAKLNDIYQMVHEIREIVVVPRKTRADGRKTRADKQFGDMRQFVEVVNALYDKFQQKSYHERAQSYAFQHYLEKNLALESWTLRRRLNEAREKHGLHLGNLPWVMPAA